MRNNDDRGRALVGGRCELRVVLCECCFVECCCLVQRQLLGAVSFIRFRLRLQL